MTNKLYIASAGAGKTTHLIKEALICEGTVLITTFTKENEAEIRRKFIKLNGCIPPNIVIQTWFSFLIEHGAKPYQGRLTNKKINGLLLVNEKSGLKFRRGKNVQYYGAEEVDKHYFSSDYRIYSDKLSSFAFSCNKKSKGAVIERISNIFQHIFIDEVQDLVGYDLELIKLLLRSKSIIKMAGDPRQVTYHTHFSTKNKKYSDGMIEAYIRNECKKIQCEINTHTLKDSWRNNLAICRFANALFPNQPQAESRQEYITDHDGIFLVRKSDITKYTDKYAPTQLRFSKSSSRYIVPGLEVKNYGESKGITRDRVIIHPTTNLLEWMLTGKDIKTFSTKCKCYVAITRAKYSVAIVCDDNIDTDKFPIYCPS